MAELSEEVIEDILSRLPAIDLLRFRCVSKPWCSLIDSPYFIKKHLNRSIESNTNLNLVLQDWIYDEFHYLRLDSPDKMVKLNSDFEGLKTEVLGSCNGLLCLYLSNNTTEEENGIVLWNPLTRKSQKLPDTPIENPNPHVWFDHTVFYGFGYEPTTSDDYKLLRIVHFYIPDDIHAHGSQVDVYSLKSNSWRRVNVSPPFFTHKRHEQECVIVDGAMHWAGTLISESGVPDIFIIAFDLVVEEFRFVPLPNSDSLLYGRVGVLDGSLYLLSYCDVFSLHMWVMKDYGVKESWTKLFSVERTDPVLSKFLKPIAYSKSGDKILIQLNIYGLLQYDLKKKRIKTVKIPGITNDFHVHVCLGSLVQLDGDGGSDEKQLRAHEKKEEVTNY